MALQGGSGEGKGVEGGAGTRDSLIPEDATEHVAEPGKLVDSAGKRSRRHGWSGPSKK